MFEKDAEEYVDLSGNRNYTERAFKDGAEFGYNKANEWHDLQENPNDLPKHTNQVLGYCRGDYYDVCFFNGKRLIGHGESDFLKWKEIV